MSSSRSLSTIQSKYWTLLFAGLTSALYLLYKYAFRPGSPDPRSTKLLKDLANPKKLEEEEEETKLDENTTPLRSNKKSSSRVIDTDDDDEESDDLISQIHAQIEQIDKKGKSLFKQKNYLEAAEVFSEAIDLINSKVKDVAKHGNLNRQLVTLMNNRSAMYEKGSMPDLALLGKIITIHENEDGK
jgi:tetratricopeptide (TPR) repeat protein